MILTQAGESVKRLEVREAKQADKGADELCPAVCPNPRPNRGLEKCSDLI